MGFLEAKHQAVTDSYIKYLQKQVKYILKDFPVILKSSQKQQSFI